MKNVRAQGRRGTERFVVHVLTVYMLFIFGCDGSLPSNYILDTTSADKLVPQASQIIEEGLSDADPRIRVNAIEVVATTRQTKFIPKVQRLLEDNYVPVRFAAALALGDVEYSFAADSVRSLLKDEDENVRIAADYALSKFGSASDFELVRKAAFSEDQKVRANAAFLLGKSGDKRGLKLLWWILQDKNSDDKVRFNVIEAIAALGDERIYPKAWAKLINIHGEDKITGMRAMRALGTTGAKNALLTMLDDDVLEVRLAAAEQLGMLGDKSGEPEVLEVFTENLTSDFSKADIERVKVMTALAIGQIGTPSLTKFLPQFLKDESKYVRIAGAKAVFQCAKKY